MLLRCVWVSIARAKEIWSNTSLEPDKPVKARRNAEKLYATPRIVPDFARLLGVLGMLVSIRSADLVRVVLSSPNSVMKNVRETPELL